MVEVKSLWVNEHNFIGVYINLPQYPIHFIISTHTILAQENFSMQYFEHMDKSVAVILCAHTFGFDGILGSTVLQANHIALNRGVEVGMSAKEAVVLCEENKDKKI